MVSRGEFEQLINDGFAAIPERFRSRVKNVALLVEEEPSPEIREREGLEEGETLLGYYHGVPDTVRGEWYGVGPTLPDTITIFKKPIEEEAHGDPDLLKKIVFDTVWHEVGHYLGLSDDEIHKREDEKWERGDS